MRAQKSIKIVVLLCLFNSFVYLFVGSETKNHHRTIPYILGLPM